jgi:putative beta-lysine N-acetyltransferase
LDKIYHLHGATIQHGHESERIYVMSLPERNEHRHLLAALEALAKENNYGKIIAKVPATAAAEFKRAGYRVEARVPGYYRGAAAALFMARYPAEQRACTPLAGQLTDILDLARSKAKSPAPPRADGANIRRCRPSDAEAMAQVYARVFASYPFAIDDADYIRQTMTSHVDYYAFLEAGEMCGLASAEKNQEASNVEMTDFAVLPEVRSRGAASYLLRAMEADQRAAGYATFYTIARALSAGMNITFARCGYTYSGTLINNTGIAGQIESMNVWYKDARDAAGISST